jgi:hypothetical protein
MSGAYRKPEAAGDAAQPGPSLELPDPDAPPGYTGGAGGVASAGSGLGEPLRSVEVTPEQAERVRATMPDEATVRREARLQESIDEQDRPPDAGSGLADPTDGPPGLPVEDEQ